MSTRYVGFVVVLDQPVRDDDSSLTLTALRQIKGVVSVTPVEADVSLQIARESAKNQFLSKTYQFLEKL